MSALSLITVPVFLETITDPATLVRQWSRLYTRGKNTAPPVALPTYALYGYAAFTRRAAGRPWEMLAAAGATTLLIVPFTIGIMLPTNNELARQEKRADDGEKLEVEGVRRLVVKWNWLHFVRSLFPLVGAVLGFSATQA